MYMHGHLAPCVVEVFITEERMMHYINELI